MCWLTTDDMGHRQAQHVTSSLDGHCSTDHPCSISVPLLHASLHSSAFASNLCTAGARRSFHHVFSTVAAVSLGTVSVLTVGQVYTMDVHGELTDELTRDWNSHLDFIYRLRAWPHFTDLPSINCRGQQSSRHSLTTSSLHVIARWPSTDLVWPIVSLGQRIVTDSVR